MDMAGNRRVCKWEHGLRGWRVQEGAADVGMAGYRRSLSVLGRFSGLGWGSWYSGYRRVFRRPLLLPWVVLQRVVRVLPKHSVNNGRISTRS
jgi:hypothetical protein